MQLHAFACGYLVVPALLIKKTILSPLNCLGSLVKTQLTVNVWVYLYDYLLSDI